MNSEARLAEIVGALAEARLPYLVMGGHAARYYGIERHTIDYDLHVFLNEWDRLRDILSGTRLFAAGPPIEGPSWRPESFRRFLIGHLSDGREEWLEFWRRNHLLAPFPELVARREEGAYGGRQMPFLSLPDLIRSTETERESDWQDVALLEEILEARNLARVTDKPSLVAALSTLRSRRGFQRAVGQMADPGVVAEAFRVAISPITRAYLTPYLLEPPSTPVDPGMVGEILTSPLCRVEAASPRHLALVEAVRRLYQQAAVAADRAEKRAALFKT